MVYYIILTLFVTVAAVVVVLSLSLVFARVELVNGSIFNLTKRAGKPWDTYIISQRCLTACRAYPAHIYTWHWKKNSPNALFS